MERRLIVTRDGSNSIEIPEMNVTYHSIHGAVQESMHVFIKEGLHHLINQSTTQPISIFEMGFGTGLNAFLTAIEAVTKGIQIHYTTVEQFPISLEEANKLNYGESLHDEAIFQKLHSSEWDTDVAVTDNFILRKEQAELINFSINKQFNLIYYDAFAPSAQPQLWTKEIFEKLYNMLLPNGILVTYCSKGDVRRAMMAAGFTVKKLAGPPGKREMLRAAKLQ
jgi:tRNA U34 5-methylaminomethyl-2-thiouridine-forming methyltransferase MnmC